VGDKQIQRHKRHGCGFLPAEYRPGLAAGHAKLTTAWQSTGKQLVNNWEPSRDAAARIAVQQPSSMV